MSQTERPLSTSPFQLATIIAGVVALYLLASVVGRTINIIELKRQQAVLETQERDLNRTIERLGTEAGYLASDSYREQVVRGTFYWGPPGERVIIPLTGESVPPLLATPPPKR